MAWHYTFSTFQKVSTLLCSLLILFPACPPLPNQLKFFLLTSFLAFLPHTWKYPQLLWQQEARLLPENSQFDTLLFTSGCIIITSSSSITLPHRAALIVSHYVDISVSRLYWEHIFRWIKTVYLSLALLSCMYHLPSLKPYFVVSFWLALRTYFSITCAEWRLGGGTVIIRLSATEGHLFSFLHSTSNASGSALIQGDRFHWDPLLLSLLLLSKTVTSLQWLLFCSLEIFHTLDAGGLAPVRTSLQ